MKTLILTPNKNLQCGMYQLAKELAKELDGDVHVRGDEIMDWETVLYNQVITFLYPVHKSGKFLKETYGLKWICYDQKVPKPTKLYFPNFFRRQYMKWFYWANQKSKIGADEYWELSEIEQKPRWTEKKKYIPDVQITYSTYIGRRTDYKNFKWLEKTMESLGIPFLPSLPNSTDDNILKLLSNAKLLVTASLWEGYGRPVMEAEALGIPAVAYDTGTHKKHIKKGICVPLGNEEEFKKAIVEVFNSK